MPLRTTEMNETSNDRGKALIIEIKSDGEGGKRNIQKRKFLLP